MHPIVSQGKNKQHNPKVPSRTKGRYLAVRGKGIYVRFESGHLYMVDLDRKVVDLTSSDKAEKIKKRIKTCDMRGVPKWAYRLLRTQEPSVVQPKQVELNPGHRQSIPAITDVSDIPKPPAPKFEPEKVVVFYCKVGARTTALVLLKNNDPKESDPFNINAEGKVSPCQNGSVGQTYSFDQLSSGYKGWKTGNLGEQKFEKLLEHILANEVNLAKAA